jgi:hypothetical protein
MKMTVFWGVARGGLLRVEVLTVCIVKGLIMNDTQKKIRKMAVS